MLRSIQSRIRFSIGALACAVLGASLFSWAHNLSAAADRYIWVRADAANASPAESGELWQVSASCVRPYFVRALFRSKASLHAYYELAPAEIRPRLDRLGRLAPSVEQVDWRSFARGEQEYIAELQVKYAEWFANVFKLKIQENSWQQRLSNVADETLVLSATARKNFAAYSGAGAKPAGSLGDFDDYVFTALGLGGFPSDEKQSLMSDCLRINLVKETLQSPHYFSQLWRWPIDCLAEFSFGLELGFVAIFFVPIALWINTGELETVKRRICDMANRFVARTNRLIAKAQDLNRRQSISGVLDWFAKIRAVGDALLTKVSASIFKYVTQCTHPGFRD